MKKRNFSVLVSSLILLIIIVFPQRIFSQIITVGSGSYTTQLPPADAAGRNLNPSGTPRVTGKAATKPIETNDWWTGLLTFDGANLYNYPLSMKGVPQGLVVSYTFLGLGANDTRQPMGPEQPIVVGVTGLSGSYPSVSDYSDWTVTASWNSNNHTFNAVMGMGMPFVYCTKGTSDIASVTINTGTVSIQNEMILVTNAISGANFAIYAPAGSTWTVSGKNYTSTLNGKNYYSVAMLPAGINASTAANDYKQYAYVFPDNTSVSWNYDNASATMSTTFTVTPDVKEGNGTNVLLGLLPHQWTHLSNSSAKPGAYSYLTSRGMMKMLASNTFVVENKFKGILSTLPNMAVYSPGFDPGILNAKINELKGASLDTWTDSYNDGLAMNRLVQVAKIADQVGNTAARDQIIATVKARMEDWLNAEAGENAFIFSYNNKWNTLIGYPAGYYSDSNLNDHHFHYGYFISAAAAIEQFNPGWAAQWGEMVNMLVKDAANPDKTDSQFPFLRTFNPYAGHSFATGLLNNEPHGNNQECSSEAMNFNASLINWGVLTNNTAIRDLGIYLYTTEQTAIEEYWFDMNDRNFSNTYAQMMCARVWGNGYDRGTFWTGDIAAMYGIQLFPLTGASLYLGQNTDYVKRLWNDMKAKTPVLSKTPNDNLWYDVYWSYLAMADPATAISLYNDYPGYKVKGGCSDAQTYHWLHTFNGMGQMDANITADYPISAVFNKEGDRTYVAHNYGSKEITVTYSDGFKMTVPARTIKTSKDVDITAKLTASALQVSASESIILSVETTGSGITKVEFYEGANLLGTSTSAPYSVEISNLTARVHGFYAKIYAGTSIKLTNAVAVIVGSQLPYGNTPVSIPSQILESGNYDYYEGGIGQNISYFDVTSWNDAGTFRSPESVDAGATPSEGNTVGWVDNGEWLEYTVNIEKAGAYDLSVRYASGNTNGGGPFHIEVDDVTVANNITVGFTSTNWSTWASKVIPGVILPSGKHVLKLAFDKGGFNIGKMSFTYKGEASPTLSVSSKSMSLAAIANSTKTVDITSNIAWSAASDQEWLKVNKFTGFGNSALAITAQENPLTESRKATITVSGNGVDNQTITVTQDPGGVPYLIVSTTNLNIGITANSNQNFDITSNINWTATSNQSWLTVNNPSGSGVAVITLTAQANTTTSNRSATITVSGEGLTSKTITVTQAGTPALLTLPIDFETGSYAFTNFDGGTANVIDNPQKSGINTSDKVARIIRNAGATWAGSYLTLNNKIDFTSLGYISMKVYSPKAGIPVLFKLEGDAAPTEVSVKTTVANAWETLTWNFTGKPSNVYNKLVFMFDFGTIGNGTASSTFLFDDIRQLKTTTGNHDLDLSAVKLYPNPANNVLYIDGIKENATITIYDSVGNTVISEERNDHQIDISNLVNGVYTIRITSNTAIITRKFIKQK